MLVPLLYFPSLSFSGTTLPISLYLKFVPMFDGRCISIEIKERILSERGSEEQPKTPYSVNERRLKDIPTLAKLNSLLVLKCVILFFGISIYFINLASFSYRSCPQKIWDAWVGACLYLHQGLELLFQKLAEKVGNWPKLTIAISFLIAAALTTGMHKYKMEKRSDRLFIPKESRSISDLDKAAAYFPMKFRAEEIVLTYTNESNVLTSTLFKKLLELDRAVKNLPNTKDLCVQYKINLTSYCSTLNVLELFKYNASNMKNVSSFMQSVYKNETLVMMTNRKLAKLNFPEMFGRINLNSNEDFVSAKSVRVVYFMKYHTTDVIYDEVMKWEDSYIKYLKSQQSILEKQGIKLYFYAYRSLDDSISESALNDMQLIIVAFVLMVLFCVLMNVRFRKPVNGHVLLTMAGILTVFLGTGASFGLVMYTNTPFIGIVAVLPFMVLGVGIDDMFILVDTLDQRQPHLQGTIRLVATLSSAGSSILMTTLTDLIAFAISTVTDFRGIEYFCLYSALAITFVFILMITFFLAFMKLDINRVENGKNDVIPCLQQESKQNPWYMEFSNVSSKVLCHSFCFKLLGLVLISYFLQFQTCQFAAEYFQVSIKLDI